MNNEKDNSTIVIFIDDTGTKEIQDKKSNFFGYGAIAVRKSNILKLSNELDALKKNFFNQNIPELKSNWLRIPKERQRKYLTIYNISDKALSKFTDTFYKWLVKQEIRVLGSIVNKEKIELKYTNPHNPSAIAYELLLQRFANLSTQYNGSKIKIVIDDMDGKTPKGNAWKDLLIRQHKTVLEGHSVLYRNWSGRNSMDYSNISKKLLFCDSRNNNLIQIADICAYNILRQSRDSWCNFESEPFYNGYKLIKKIIHKNPNTNLIFKNGVVNFPE